MSIGISEVKQGDMGLYRCQLFVGDEALILVKVHVGQSVFRCVDAHHLPYTPPGSLSQQTPAGRHSLSRNPKHLERLPCLRPFHLQWMPG